MDGIAVDYLAMLHVSDPQNRDSNQKRALAIGREIVAHQERDRKGSTTVEPFLQKSCLLCQQSKY
jgi:hypothetical protein